MPDETKTCVRCRWAVLDPHDWPCILCSIINPIIPGLVDHFEPTVPVDDTAKEDEDELHTV
jgi:hypothetical protein